MLVAVIVSFAVVFVLVLMAVSVGLKFFDQRRKKQVSDMLQTAAGETVAPLAAAVGGLIVIVRQFEVAATMLVPSEAFAATEPPPDTLT